MIGLKSIAARLLVRWETLLVVAIVGVGIWSATLSPFFLKSANLLAADANSADLVVRVYLFHFGLAEGSGLDFFGKVEFSTIVKNPKTGETAEVKATGTSIAKGAAKKKNVQKNVQDDLEESLKDATRNFLRGQQLKDAVAALWKAGEAAPSSEAKSQ